MAQSFEQVYSLLSILKEQHRQLAGNMSGVEQDVFAAFSVADRAYVMETGRIVREGPVAELADDPAVRDAYLGTAG
jgi:ABC-type branched-subunit amino acid transport system ATPase component